MVEEVLSIKEIPFKVLEVENKLDSDVDISDPEY